MSQSQNQPLADYYAKRAREYERIYAKPERRADLVLLKERFRDLFSGHNVLEIACGTGYWTEVIAQSAKSIVATDLNEEVLEIAKSKSFPGSNVTFEKADAWSLQSLNGRTFTTAFAMHWWSHLRKSEVGRFLAELHSILSQHSLIVFADNRFVPGSSTPLSRTDAEGNTYQLRKLDSGEKFEILKNFPDETEFRASVGNNVEEFKWVETDYYWVASYRLKS